MTQYKINARGSETSSQYASIRQAELSDQSWNRERSANLARVKLVIRAFMLQQARSLLDEASGMEDGIAIHRLLSGALEEAGVYGY